MLDSNHIHKSHIIRSQRRLQLGKMSFQMLILISALCFAAHSEAKWKLQDNVYVIDSTWTSHLPPEEVDLHCNVSGKHNASVYWKKDNKLVSHDAHWKIKVKEPVDAGHFTCWSKATNELLSYTTLYVAKKNYKEEMIYQILKTEESSNSIIKCTANNYSGNFTCSWMIEPQSQNRDLKFEVRIVKTDNSSGNVTCGEPIRDSASRGRYLVSCKKEKPCLAAEEYQPIKIDLHVYDENMYENDTLSFLIKDILKPDITECEIARTGTSNLYQVTWQPPSTWSIPVSYFPLTYQIKTVGTTVKICEVDMPLENGNRKHCTIKIRDKKFGNCYIRSRDYYENSAWSEWSKPCSGSQENGQNHHAHDDTEIKISPCICQKN